MCTVTTFHLQEDREFKLVYKQQFLISGGNHLSFIIHPEARHIRMRSELVSEQMMKLTSLDVCKKISMSVFTLKSARVFWQITNSSRRDDKIWQIFHLRPSRERERRKRRHADGERGEKEDGGRRAIYEPSNFILSKNIKFRHERCANSPGFSITGLNVKLGFYYPHHIQRSTISAQAGLHHYQSYLSRQ